jgi:hypothetical protein
MASLIERCGHGWPLFDLRDHGQSQEPIGHWWPLFDLRKSWAIANLSAMDGSLSILAIRNRSQKITS